MISTTNQIIATIGTNLIPEQIAITPNQLFAYIPTIELSVVDVPQCHPGAVIISIPVGSGPFGVAISPNGAFVYITNSTSLGSSSGSVSVISTASNTVVHTIEVGDFPVGIAITPNGAFAMLQMSSVQM